MYDIIVLSGVKADRMYDIIVLSGVKADRW